MEEAKLICINPHTKNIHGTCTRFFSNRCCVCDGPKVLIDLEDVNDMIQDLATSGSNSKAKVRKRLIATVKGVNV